MRARHGHGIFVQYGPLQLLQHIDACSMLQAPTNMYELSHVLLTKSCVHTMVYSIHRWICNILLKSSIETTKDIPFLHRPKAIQGHQTSQAERRWRSLDSTPPCRMRRPARLDMSLAPPTWWLKKPSGKENRGLENHQTCTVLVNFYIILQNKPIYWYHCQVNKYVFLLGTFEDEPWTLRLPHPGGTGKLMGCTRICPDAKRGGAKRSSYDSKRQ